MSSGHREAQRRRGHEISSAVGPSRHLLRLHKDGRLARALVERRDNLNVTSDVLEQCLAERGHRGQATAA